jgi:hypothetical protein
MSNIGYSVKYDIIKGIGMLRRDIIKRQEMRDAELFGFGKKYKLSCTTAILNIVSNYHEFEFIEKGLGYLEDEDPDIRFDIEDCDEVSRYLDLVLTHAKKDTNILSKSTKIENDYRDDKWVYAKKNQIDYFYDPDFIDKTINALSNNKKIGKQFFQYSLDCIEYGLSTYNDKNILASLNKLKNSINKAITYMDANMHLIDEDKEEMETTKGTYVAINVENHEQLFNWFKDQGIEPIVSTEMHCTIAYSRVEFNIDNYIGRIIIKPEQFIGIEELGNEGCAVLKYNSDELQDRFNTCMSAGATYDYDSYIPHTTFALNLTKEQISKLKLPNFDIVLVGEYTDELDIEWKSKIEKDEEAMENKDIELFGFGKKYQSTLTYTKFDDYFKGSGYMEAAWEVLSVEIPDDKTIEVFLTKLDMIKKNYEVGVKPVTMRVVSVDNHIINDKTHDKIMGDMVKIHEANKKYINDKAPSDKKSKLNQINDGYYNIIKRVRTTLKNGIKPVVKDKESYMVSGVISTVVSAPVEYIDNESYRAISGLVANGFKKVSGIIIDISSEFTTSNPDYSKLTKGFIFFDKNKKFQDVYNILVGVPAGYTGYVLDVSKYVVDNLHYINTLDKELDNTINILSMYINSKDYRESFILDLTTVKAIESIAKDLLESNRKYIINSNDDSKSIGKLLRNANEVDAIVENLKEASKLLDLKTLESIKFKMKQVDNLVSTMIDNKNVYSKNKLLEIAKLIDAIISLSNGVSTVVYLKNSSDIILEDIKVIL